MRNKEYLRYGLASMIVVGGAMGAGLVACGDDDDGVVSGKDAGGTDTSQPDSSTTDSSTADAADGAVKKANAKLVVVNAATDFGPSADFSAAKFQAIRVCFALAATSADALLANASPLPPQPDSPQPAGRPVGIYIGTGGVFKSFGLNLEPLAVRPIIMNAKTLAEKGIIKPGPGKTGSTCDEILKAGATLDGSTFTENVDYWKLPPIEPGTFKTEKSFALVLTGCTGDAVVAAPEQCGDGYTPTGTPGPGNLKARVYELSRPATIPATEVATQFAHVSAPAAYYLNGNDPGDAIIPVVPGFADDNAGTNFKPVPGKNDGGVVNYSELTDVKNVTGVSFASHYFTANPQAPLGAPIPLISAVSWPNGVPDGGEYRNGAAFTVFAVGDPLTPADAGGNFNPRTFHYLAFPNDPPVENYVP